MSPLAVAIVSGALWFAIFIAAHLGWAQFARDSRFSRIIATCFALALLGSVTTVAMSHGALWNGSYWSWVLAEGGTIFLMFCAFVLYMPFVFVVATSLSVDTMLILSRAGGELARADLDPNFVSAEAVRRRLDTMRLNGLLSLRNEHFDLTPRATRTATLSSALKRLWKLWPGG